MYGKSPKYSRTNRGRSTRSGRGSGAGSFKRAYVPKRRTYSGHNGYNRTMRGGIKRETKYMDDYYNLNAWQKRTNAASGVGGGFTNWILGGVLRTEKTEVALTSDQGLIHAPQTVSLANCLTNVESGTTASTRIGNVVEPRFITVKGVMTASTTTSIKDPETTYNTEAGSGEQTVIERYCRTSIRLMVIRDKSMNEQGFVNFTDMFTPPITEDINTSEFMWNRNINTMGRYEILKQAEWTLDQDDPQKCFNWTIGLGGKQIRYNGGTSSRVVVGGQYQSGWTAGTGTAQGAIVLGSRSSDAQSMTNGIYIIGVATNISNATNVEMGSPTIVFSTRCGFYDN